jgi:hypothetical protein
LSIGPPLASELSADNNVHWQRPTQKSLFGPVVFDVSNCVNQFDNKQSTDQDAGGNNACNLKNFRHNNSPAT